VEKLLLVVFKVVGAAHVVVAVVPEHVSRVWRLVDGRWKGKGHTRCESQQRRDDQGRAAVTVELAGRTRGRAVLAKSRKEVLPKAPSLAHSDLA